MGEDVTSDTETLRDCSAVLDVPDGLTLCNSLQTQNVGDLRPNGVADVHWYLRDAENTGDGMYRFTCPVFADRMSDRITAQMIFSRSTVGTVCEYSVEDYMNYILSHTDVYDAKTVNSIKALMNFGGYVQVYTGRGTDMLVNRDLDMPLDDVTVDISDDYNAVTDNSSDSVTVTSANLYLNSLAGIRFRFKTDDIDAYTFTIDGREVTPVRNGDGYMVSVDSISPDNYDHMYCFRAQSKTDENDYTEVSYSCLTYAKTILAGDYSADVKNAMKAMYLYNRAIEDYIA